jgi:membrane fusion protein (multidrug efflux system)
MVSIVPKVAAYVTALNVDDNTSSAAGLGIAEADLENARANAANVDVQVGEQHSVVGRNEASIAGDHATLEFSRQILYRYGSLAQTGAGTRQRFQQAQSDTGEREASVRRDQAALDAARAHILVLKTARRQARQGSRATKQNWRRPG